MSKFSRWIRSEVDAEILGSAYGMSLVWLYGFMLWINKTDAVPFLIIFEMFLLGYVMAWLQNLLFYGRKTYGKTEYRVRTAVWIIGPVILAIAAQFVFHWFQSLPGIAAVIFDLILIIYFVIVWILVKTFYMKDTKELNQLLTIYKEKKESKCV